MTNITPIDVVDTGLNRLTWDLTEKENIEKLFTLFLSEVQKIEDTLLDILDIKDIDTAVGVQLDNIGMIIGVERLGKGDDEYREEIRFKISISTSNGTYQTIYDIIKTFTESDRLNITPSSIAFATLYFNGKKNTGSQLYDLLNEIKPAGTRWVIQSDVSDNAMLFAWEQKQANLENFQVIEDGSIYQNFQVTEDGINFEDFLIGDDGIAYYQPSLIEGRNNFYWEEPEIFYITEDGVNYEPLFLDDAAGTYPEFKVENPLNTPDNLVTLPWEVTDVSKALI